ncbi:MAG: cysteine synthase family protein [Candidatus Aenigmatarchaeota archaeon]
MNRGNMPINILKWVGNTPIVRIKKIANLKGVELCAKAEFLNPSGSIKDRIVKYMIESAERKGFLTPGATIVEPTSGNTGIAFAMISAIKGYKFVAVLPEFASKERIKIMRHYGAKVVLTPKEAGIYGAVQKAKRLALKGMVLLNQFENVDNVNAHHQTGYEILREVKRVDAFVAGVGTGGTLMGVAEVLKKKAPGAQIVAVEPYNSAVLSGGAPGAHRIEGIGEGFIPKLVEDRMNLIDKIIKVKDSDAIRMAARLSKEEGLFVGISSGANVVASLKIARGMKKGAVVTVLPDSADRYMDTYRL